jgi:RNA polymerase-binding protein DksA
MEYESIKNELLRKKDELEIRLSNTHKHITHADGPPNPDFAEQAVERQNDEVIYGLNESARAELIQIKQALERIASGEYGICQECGRQIPMERLKAIPYTSYCVECLE